MREEHCVFRDTGRGGMRRVFRLCHETRAARETDKQGTGPGIQP
jgi:hypothetical protein